MFARHRQDEVFKARFGALDAVGEDHVEMRGAFGEADIDRAYVGLRRETIGDEPAVDDTPDHRLHFGMIDAKHRKTVERHVLDETLEGVAHLVEGAVIIEMVGVDVGDDGDHRRKAQESAVALVGFHHHPFAGAQPRIGAVSVDDAAVDDGGIEPASIQQRRDHRRGRRLAVGAGHRDAGFQPHDLGQHFGAAH